MKIIKYPDRSQWDSLTLRPAIDKSKLDWKIIKILEDIKSNGDQAIYKYNTKYDGYESEVFQVTKSEIEKAAGMVYPELKEAIEFASKNISTFHTAHKEIPSAVETSEGVYCWRESRPIEKVGLYIPGGTAPLFSSILMLAIPARIAGCKEIILCTPPGSEGEINPAILYTASLCGITKIFKVGGAQAIAAMAYGTESIPEVYKIFGPGNQFVTRAKEMVQLDGIAIDMPAGPSELLIICDKDSNPAFVAADLLSQCEHGEDSQVILLSDSLDTISQSIAEIGVQVELLPRKDIAKRALANSKVILLKSIIECFDFSNEYAPEHLILTINSYKSYLGQIESAGSVFLGPLSCESAGDYASGTNHTLPTNGFARAYSGVSLDSFIKKISFQEINNKGLKNIGKHIAYMATAEGLIAHKNAVSIRLKTIDNV